MHARRVRPDTGPIDRRRLVAAGLSAVLPGLGQAFNRRGRLAALFLIPSLVLVLVAYLLLTAQSPTRLAAWMVGPSVLSTLLILNVVVLGWRLLAVLQAFLDTRRSGPVGRLGVLGLVLILALVVLPHLVAYRYGTALQATFASVFEAEANGSVRSQPDAVVDGPSLDERINVLLVGIDKARDRETILTDTMMVVSLDPVGKSVSVLSIPRDMVNVPLGNGDDFGPKVNSLMSYVNDHRDQFDRNGIQTLKVAIGSLLDIPIHYYAQMNFRGFMRMIDAVGGVDVEVKEAISDPEFGAEGYAIEAGEHHLDGEEALAYVRSRKGAGESDFTRAGRQQQVLLALRDAVTSDGSLLWELPDLLDAVGSTVRTDLPIARLPELAAIADEVDDDAVVRSTIRHPLVRTRNTRYGSSLVPDLEAIRAVAARLFPEPGGEPVPWPTPKPTKPPKPPKATPTP